MQPSRQTSTRPAADRLDTRQREAVLDLARRLGAEARAGRRSLPLAGRNMGLIWQASDPDSAALFERAARELGARVSRLSFDLDPQGAEDDAERMAQALGKLYDAVECQGLAPPSLALLRRHAGVPVFDGIARPEHPSAALAAALAAGGAPAPEARLHVLQAMLLLAIG